MRYFPPERHALLPKSIGMSSQKKVIHASHESTSSGSNLFQDGLVARVFFLINFLAILFVQKALALLHKFTIGVNSKNE